MNDDLDDGVAVYRDSVERMISILRDTFGSEFKMYYKGDPIEIPDVNLPCVIVQKMGGQTIPAPTGTDEVRIELQVRILLNKADDYDADGDTDMTEARLERYLEARDSVTGQWLEGSVLGTLRKNLTLGSSVLENDMDWNYYVQPRANSVVTSEALLSIIIRQRIEVPNRL